MIELIARIFAGLDGIMERIMDRTDDLIEERDKRERDKK